MGRFRSQEIPTPELRQLLALGTSLWALGANRVHICREGGPLEWLLTKKETFLFPRATFLFAKFMISLLREPVPCHSVFSKHNKRTDTANLVHIRGGISISFISLAADRVHVWEVFSMFSASSPRGESDTLPPHCLVKAFKCGELSNQLLP